MITAGTYVGRVVAESARWTTTSSGNDQVTFELDLEDIGETVRCFLVLTDKTKSWVFRKLAACGWDGANLDTLDGLGSTRCDVSVRYEDWKGRTQQRVDIVLPRPKSASSMQAKYGADVKAAIGSQTGFRELDF